MNYYYYLLYLLKITVCYILLPPFTSIIYFFINKLILFNMTEQLFLHAILKKAICFQLKLKSGESMLTFVLCILNKSIKEA